MSPRDELFGQCPQCGNTIPRCVCSPGTPTLDDCIEWMRGYVFTEGHMPSERVCRFLNQDIFPAVLSYLRQHQQSLRDPPPVVTTPEPAQAATNSAGKPNAHARYENGFYYCWLIERRDRSQPWWLDVHGFWTPKAHTAQWFARQFEADIIAGQLIEDVVVCEHAFQLDDKGNP